MNRPRHHHYDVVIAGARCAGASTAMLLARQGLRVLVVDPTPRGSDTLSTHALMRPAVLQLHRWGLLDRLREAGTPPVRTTSFHYGDEEPIEVAIKARDGVDALYAPRRAVIDRILVEAAEEAGAEVLHGRSVVDLLRGDGGRVHGAVLGGRDGEVQVTADLLIGADGVRSRVARLVETEVEYAVEHTTASIYGYWKDPGMEGYHWYYSLGASVGSIPTNDGVTCVFASLPPERFERERGEGLDPLYHEVLREVSTDLAERVARSAPVSSLRAFPGATGFMRRASGPGWALVGDAGYFRDPLTAHGMTDAFRDAELLARAVVVGGDEALHGYQAARDGIVRGLLDVTDRIASFDWDLEEAKTLHLALSEEMQAEYTQMRGWDDAFARPVAPAPASVAAAV